jgi:DNA polymerase (family 10)
MNEKQSTLFPKTPDEFIPNYTVNVLQDLDRAELEPLAEKILRVIEPWCIRVMVAGSFRRGKQIINDLDIVVQPQPSIGCWPAILRSIRDEFDGITEKQGDKLATLYLPFESKQGKGHVQVDFYRADPTTWGILLLVRTGSKEHNVKLCNLAMAKGLRLQYSVGLTDGSGRVVAGRTEEEVFSALGLPFIEPKDREV